MFTICILFNILTKTTQGMCEGATNPRPKNSTYAPSDFEIPGSATADCLCTLQLEWDNRNVKK